MLSIRTALLLSSVIVAVLVALAHPLPAAASLDCQSASKVDPLSASNIGSGANLVQQAVNPR